MNMPTTFTGLINKSYELNTDLFTLFSILSSDEDTVRYRNLIKETEQAAFFKFNGDFYKGNREVAVIAFMLENPIKADFSVWLQDNYKRYSPIS